MFDSKMIDIYTIKNLFINIGSMNYEISKMSMMKYFYSNL